LAAAALKAPVLPAARPRLEVFAAVPRELSAVAPVRRPPLRQVAPVTALPPSAVSPSAAGSASVAVACPEAEPLAAVRPVARR
jgi:hypothetical protein